LSQSSQYDAVVIGSGPNGLCAAVELVRAGRSVLVLEAEDTIGGGTRTQQLTQPGFHHDACSAVHPMGVLSPFFRELPLAEHGLEWVYPSASVAHPLDDRPAAVLSRDLQTTGATLGPDADRWRRLIEPLTRPGPALFGDILAPLGIPKHPLTMARLGWYGLRSARRLARGRFESEAARALFAGNAAHSILPLTHLLTAAVGLVFSTSAHLVDWPMPRGGSAAITAALASYFKSLGGVIETGRRVRAHADLPPHRAALYNVTPSQLIRIADGSLPARYVRRLGRYRYGPGVFKVDWALDGPIPWADPACAGASTVHVGGTLDEITASEADAWHGRICERPFLIVCQQSNFDPTRAPQGKHTGYAYCHVPHGSTTDMSARIEAQVERFAPGFRDLILARHTLSPADFERRNENYLGGAITGGVADLRQLFTRPVARWNPYTTPNSRVFLCSASTPPGGGVHGMCGYYAARAALSRILK